MLTYKEIKFGDNGEDVKDLQARLLQVGFGTCLLDNKVQKLEVDGSFGPITRECLEAFQTQVLIDSETNQFAQEAKQQFDFKVTGEFDFYTFYVLYNLEALSAKYGVSVTPPEVVVPPIMPGQDLKNTFIKEVIALAKSEVGVVEDKPYNNSGTRVNEYQKIGSCGVITTGAPWCQFFMNWLIIETAKKLGKTYKWTCSGYTPDNVNLGVKKGIGKKNAEKKDIHIGAFGYIYSPSRKNARHVFLIVGMEGNNVITIEGNTNGGGSPEGYGVFVRRRPISSVWGVVNWFELY